MVQVFDRQCSNFLILLRSHRNSSFWAHSTQITLPFFYLFIFLGCTGRHVELPCPSIEPVAAAVETQSPNHWTTREILPLSLAARSQHLSISLLGYRAWQSLSWPLLRFLSLGLCLFCAFLQIICWLLSISEEEGVIYNLAKLSLLW